MRLVKAELVKLVTRNGFGRVKDGVPLGRVYTVDLDSISHVTLEHESGRVWETNVVDIVENGKSNGWIFLELLKIDEIS